MSIAHCLCPPRPRAAAPPHKIAREHSRKPCCADALRAGRWPSGQGAAAGSAEVQVRLWQQPSESAAAKKMSQSRPLLPLDSQCASVRAQVWPRKSDGYFDTTHPVTLTLNASLGLVFYVNGREPLSLITLEVPFF